MMRLASLSLLFAAVHGSERALLNSRTVVAFSGKDYDGWEKDWDWNTITHLAFWSNPKDDVRARAKENNVKLFKVDGAHLDPKDWTDSKKVSKAVDLIKQQVEDDDLDGTFVDYEGNGLSKDQKQAYTDYVAAIQDAIAPKEIFVCVGGRPTYEWRDYDYKGLAKASSFLFIMGYDMHFWDDYSCVGKGTCSPAEAPLADLKDGVKAYLDEVDGDKLVLGLPWYGQRYTQVAGIEANQGQVDLADVWPILYGDKQDRKKSHTFYDNDKDCAWKLMCNNACLEDKKGGVIWYDDEQSLAKKYALAADNNLLGVGVWEVDKLDYSGKYDKYVKRMWDALGSWAATATNASIVV
jgi:spore germination protein YaaH